MSFKIPGALFEVTNQCNLRCKHCYKKYLGTDDLTPQQTTLILDKISDFGIKHLLITGGEPFLRKDLFKIIDYALESGIEDVAINTNGTLLNNPDIVHGIIERLDFISGIPVSFDGASPATHDFIRGAGQFDRLMKILKHSSINDLPLEVNVTLGQWNFAEFEAFFDIYDELYAQNINFGIFIPMGLGSSMKNEVLSRQQCKNIIVWAKDKIDLGYQVELCSLPYSNLFVEDISGSCCNIFTDFITITGKGDVIPCILYDFSCGSLLEVSLDDILSTKLAKEFRTPQLMQRKMKGHCEGCPTFELCKGGCHLLTYTLSNTIYDSDLCCPFQDEFRIPKI